MAAGKGIANGWTGCLVAQGKNRGIVTFLCGGRVQYLRPLSRASHSGDTSDLPQDDNANPERKGPQMTAFKGKHTILGIHITDRLKEAVEVQKQLTACGRQIKTRLGLHEISDDAAGLNGICCWRWWARKTG